MQTWISEERSYHLDVIYLERDLLKRVILLIVSELSEKVVRFNFLMNDDAFFSFCL